MNGCQFSVFLECKLYKQDRAVEHDEIAQAGISSGVRDIIFFVFSPCFPLVPGP